ncbi:MAG: carbohydrate ABC transporter permease [Lachnospiraceae bacterium]|nr:carbohydrate ABC transporter permease [Lachnospiraceae bacterium]MBR4412282.1 carbohydrate ABC transporter permease [Lachnospiraceae bacterium]MBR5066903.1 carbohydrate ABC transporter permease [Lachnospiraceae bacterium]MBR5916481.1 carbohydrate ABC transporter permease [Lachnospiraceae bacterium]
MDQNKKDKRLRIRKRLKRITRTLILFVIALGFAVIFLLPTVLTITNSFMNETEINANYGKIFATTDTGGKVFVSDTVYIKFIPNKVSFEQYSSVLFKSPDYLYKFWNSVIYTVPIMILQLVVALLASYGFMRLKGRLKEMLFFIYIIICLMPYQVTLVPNFLVSKWLNIIDTRWAIWLPGMFSPFAVYLLTKYMKRIPTSIIEAAKVDGASEWKIFLKICLPLCKGAIYSVAILIFIDFWNMVEQPLILLADEYLHPLSIFLSKINSGEIGLAFAVACVYMVPSLLIFLYGEDYLVEGISYQGGVKG